MTTPTSPTRGAGIADRRLTSDPPPTRSGPYRGLAMGADPRPSSRSSRPGRPRRVSDPVSWTVALTAITLGLWAVTGGLADLVSGGVATWLSVSRLSGLLAALAALLGLVLTARPRWLERTAGLDRLIGWHRVTGMTAALGMLVHVATGLVAAAGGTLTGTWAALVGLLGTDWFVAALAAAALFAVVSVTSWRRIRRRMSYEAWHMLHIVGYLGVALGMPHQLFSGSTFVTSPVARWWWIGLYAATAAIVLHSRAGGLVRALLRPETRITRVIPEAPGVVSLVITGRGVDRLDARPGQFVCLRVLNRDLWWQAHPYSLSAVPRKGAMRLTVKALGDASRQTVGLQPGARVILEGPYGALCMERAEGRPLLLIGAGVGLAPMRALLEATPADQSPVVLARAHSHEDLPLGGEMATLAAQRGGRLVPVTGPRTQFPGGNPFTAAALTSHVPDIRQRAVFVCGPAALQSRVVDELRRAGVPTDQIHAERFAW